MIMGWRRMKGMGNDMFECPGCHATRLEEEYSLEDDLCLLCLFPEASDRRPADINTDGVNETNERKILDNLDYIPEKQSESSQEAFKSFKMRNYGSKSPRKSAKNS